MSMSFLYHIFSRFCMFCSLLGRYIRWAFTGQLVLWFLLVIFHSGLEDRVKVLIVTVPGTCNRLFFYCDL